jgi:GT2 family glycosyltransferase
MKLGLVIASHARSEILQQVLAVLVSQRRLPDYIVISAVSPADVPPISQDLANVQTLFGSTGLTCQRNRGMSCLINTVDLIAFIDDDFIVGDDYFLNLERLFEQDDSIVGLSGNVIADGANSSGFTFEEGLRLAEQYDEKRGRAAHWWIREMRSTYGCNMAFRTAGIGSLLFDERLPLYGWQEDSDFCGALRGAGRIVWTNRIWGVHLGTKHGKGSEVGLGYSQIINPAYILRKGNMSFADAFQLIARNLLANLVGSIRPRSYIDRRGRLRGNSIGMFHLMTGRFTPEHILKLK